MCRVLSRTGENHAQCAHVSSSRKHLTEQDYHKPGSAELPEECVEAMPADPLGIQSTSETSRTAAEEATAPAHVIRPEPLNQK